MLFATDGFSATHSLVVQVARLSFQERQSMSILVCSHFHRSRRPCGSRCRVLLAVELEQKKAAKPRGSLLFFQTTGGDARSLQSIKDGILYDETAFKCNKRAPGRLWSHCLSPPKTPIACKPGDNMDHLRPEAPTTFTHNSNHATVLAPCFLMIHRQSTPPAN
jgi:hypothetical protein